MRLFKEESYYSENSRGFSSKRDKHFKFFKYGVWVLAFLLMLCSLIKKPVLYEKTGRRMTFAPEVKSDMKRYSLSVPLYSKPDRESRIIRNYTNVDEVFIFLERSKGKWIKVIDRYGDTGWISSYLLRFVPGK